MAEKIGFRNGKLIPLSLTGSQGVTGEALDWQNDGTIEWATDSGETPGFFVISQDLSSVISEAGELIISS